MADGLKDLAAGIGTWFSTNGWTMFLIFVLLVIGCGGCGGGCVGGGASVRPHARASHLY